MLTRNQKGAVAPLIAILLVLIVVCVALVVDLGHIHNVKVELQRAVDAAALAGAQQLPDETNIKAVAIATAAANSVDNAPLVITTGDVNLGWWDKEALGQEATLRFHNPPPSEETVNAVKVTATRNVDHFFFFFDPDGTDVTADAIAIREAIPLATPIAVVSCIPTGGEDVLGILRPGETVNDLALFTFGTAPTDTAGWTSLVVDVASNDSVSEFMNECGIDLFKRIIGSAGSPPGLETASIHRDRMNNDLCTFAMNSIPKPQGSYCGIPVNIQCGLGGILLPDNPPAFQADPLNYTPLPRWYHETDLKKVWTMGGVLEPISGIEVNLANGKFTVTYVNRMNDLYKASDPVDPYSYAQYNSTYPERMVPSAIQDDRFTRYIDKSTNNTTNKVDFKKILEEAGYPAVKIMNGVTSVIPEMLKILEPQENVFAAQYRKRNEPFDTEDPGAAGETVRLSIPVIFSGSCSQTNFNQTGIYVGQADLLVTRIWETRQANNSYDNGTASVTVDTNLYPYKFGPTRTIIVNGVERLRCPPLTNNQIRQTTGFSGDNKVFEGLVKIPAEGGEAGITKIFLVE